MKRIIASAGLVAVGATGLYGQTPDRMEAAESRLGTTKPWTVSAALRGFYDDNIFSTPNQQRDVNGTLVKKDSFGLELRPSVAINLGQRAQTTFGASYTYGMKWFESRVDNEVDQSHEFDVNLIHRFNERYRASLNDSFVYSQEPEVVAGVGTPSAYFQRSNQDVVRNRGAIEVNGALTEQFGFAVGYENTFYDFLEGGLFATVLNRIEQTIRLDGRWQARPDLVGILGYQYGMSDYTSDDIIIGNIRGSDRSSTSHFVYVGAEYKLRQDLTAKARAGAQFTEWDNLPQSESSVSPFADISANYRYTRGGYVQVGIRQERNATDQVGVIANNVVRDQESTVVYGSINHKITTRVTGSLMGQYQHSIFQGGNLQDLADNFLTLGISLRYKITPMFTAETGYNFDRLDSDLGSTTRSFTRDRIYVGLRATY